jgi:hypothetical protein
MTVNANGCPKRYRAEFIEPGIINYEDVGQGKVFVSRETLDRMRSSFIGKPVVNAAHKDLSFEEAFKLSDEDRESLADGIIYNCGWLPTGWGFADMIVWDLDTQKNIDQKKFSVSCAYQPTEAGINGKWHNFEYDEEVKNGVYTHMAIVNNPRYEGSKIYELSKEYQNSLADNVIKTYYEIQKESNNNMAKENKILKFFMPKKNEGEKTQEEKDKEAKELEAKKNAEEANGDEKINAEEAMVDIEGKQVPLSEIIKIYQAEQEELAKTQTNAQPLNPEDEVEVDGKKVLVSELMACYSKNTNKNAGEETAEEKAKKEAETKEASVKKNANFNKLQNAITKSGSEFKVSFTTENERYAEGQKRYGSKKEAK